MELKTTKQTVMLNSFQHLHLNQTLCKKDEILNQVQDDNRMGFTLIELLVVVLIIGILAAVAVPQYQKAVAKSRATQDIINLNAIIQAQKVYYLANGEFTNDLAELDVQVESGYSCNLSEDKQYVDCWGLYDSITRDGYRLNFGAWPNSVQQLCAAPKLNALGNNICISLGNLANIPSENYNYYRIQ